MKKRTQLIIVAGFVLIAFFTVAAILIAGRSYTVYLPNPYNSDKVEIQYSAQGIIENTKIQKDGGYTKIAFRSLKQGAVSTVATVYNESNTAENTTVYYNFTVLPSGVIYLTGYDFGGYVYLLLGMMLFTLFLFIICFLQFSYRRKTQFFSYKTVLDLALIFFFGIQSLMYFVLLGGAVFAPERLSGWQIYNLAGFIMSAVLIASLPLLFVFAAFLSVSNLSLIRHEGFGKNNLFGILISAGIFVGTLTCLYAIIKYPNSIGTQLYEIRQAVARTVLSSAFVYFECILLASQLCTLYAAKHQPKYNQDFILILGCKIKADGTPTPLLRGRADRAIEFYRNQLRETGKQAYFIPTGGQGSDEVMSEGACIKEYLLAQGIEERLIFAEEKSTTTLENMLYSKKIADERNPEANILFSTTNYHVFRSGMLSAKAGMRADGVGAKTKWYFWPNAQMREFIGLLASEWKINLLFIVLSVALSVLLANIPSMISLLV